MSSNAPGGPIPEALRRYVLTSVPSVPFVEAMLVFRGEPQSTFSIDDVARRLYIRGQQAAEILDQLRDARILERVENGHRYAPPPELAPTLDQLAEFYRSNLVEVTALIHSHTGRVAQQFADAFKLRRD